MSAEGLSGWLGYAGKGRTKVMLSGLGERIVLLGKGAAELESLVSFAIVESGARIFVLDLDQSLSPDVYGYFVNLDYRSLLYDAFCIEGEDGSHGQLAATAYSAALALSYEEGTALGAALHRIAAEQGMATPAAIFDALGAVEGFRGPKVDNLRGRVGAMKAMEAPQHESFVSLHSGNTLVSFNKAPYPQAAELALALFLAKLLWLIRTHPRPVESIMVTGAHRLFGHSNGDGGRRLLTALLEGNVPLLIVASPMPPLLDEILLECMTARICSSDAWSTSRNQGDAVALPSSYMICDSRDGRQRPFFPRWTRAKPSKAAEDDSVDAGTRPPPQNGELTKTVMDEIDKSDRTTRQSLIAYLAPQFLTVDIADELGRLQREGYVVEELKKTGRDTPIFAYSLTESGRRLLSRLNS